MPIIAIDPYKSCTNRYIVADSGFKLDDVEFKGVERKEGIEFFLSAMARAVMDTNRLVRHYAIDKSRVMSGNIPRGVCQVSVRG